MVAIKEVGSMRVWAKSCNCSRLSRVGLLLRWCTSWLPWVVVPAGQSLVVEEQLIDEGIRVLGLRESGLGCTMS